MRSVTKISLSTKLIHYLNLVYSMHSEKNRHLWFNGKFVPWEDAKTHVLDHGLHYGTGIFEGIRAYETHDGNSAVFRLREHVERMYKSADVLGTRIPYEKHEVVEAIINTVRKNQLRECYIRPLVWCGFGELGLFAENLPINVMVAVWKWGNYLQKECVRAKISTWTRNNPNSFPSATKNTGGYVNAVLAAREARVAGYDEAIMLDYRGFISEGPGENIFLVENDLLLTPPVHASILPGITRDTVKTIARDLEYEVVEEDITRSRVYSADEAFFTGTAAEITPICEIDDRRIGSGKQGPITIKIKEEYRGIVQGKKQHYRLWLTYVYE